MVQSSNPSDIQQKDRWAHTAFPTFGIRPSKEYVMRWANIYNLNLVKKQILDIMPDEYSVCCNLLLTFSQHARSPTRKAEFPKKNKN